MRASLEPFSFLIVSLAGWLNHKQQHVIDYLVEENRVLPENSGGGSHNRHAANAIGVASEINRPEIRRQRVPNSRTATDVNGDLGPRHSNGRREWRLGLSAD